MGIFKWLARALVGIACLAWGAQTVLAQEVAQGYQADEQLQRGLIVQLKANDSQKVEPATTSSADKAFGVVINASDTPIVLEDPLTNVYVGTQGRFEVLVTDDGGEIRSGDYLGLSRVPGVAQKVDSSQSVTLGRALQDFAPQQGSQVLSTAEVGNGMANIGRILVELEVATRPGSSDQPTEQTSPYYLQRASELVAGRPVNPVRQYISLVILILVSGLAGSLAYGAVRSSITAIGRNPLGRQAITGNLTKVLIMAFAILLSGLFAVYLILRL